MARREPADQAASLLADVHLSVYGGNSTTWMNTAILVTCMRNFRKNRGPVSGILKGYVGLSTAIFTDLCSALFSDSSSSFLVMLAVVPAVVCFTAMVFLRVVDPSAAEAGEEQEESRYFSVFNVVAVYLLLFDVTGNHRPGMSRSFAAVLLASPMGLMSIASKNYLTRKKCSELEDKIREPLLTAQTQTQQQKPEEAIPEEEEQVVKKKPAIGEDHTILDVIQTVDFWVLLVSFLCGVGTELAVMNNLG